MIIFIISLLLYTVFFSKTEYYEQMESDRMPVIILIALMAIPLGFLSGWEETQQLIQRGSWRLENFKKIFFWFTDQSGKWKNFDSHHIAFGLFILALGLTLYFYRLNELWEVALFWLFFFYWRNIMMHLIMPVWRKDNPNLRIGYLWGNIKFINKILRR